MSARVPIALGLLLALLPPRLLAAEAAGLRAWLDRDRVRLGETVTLNLEAEGVDGEPDFSALPPELEIRARTSSSQTRIVNGAVQHSTLWALALEPTREGRIEIPALEVDGVRSEALVLTVTTPPRGASGAGDPVFLEAEIDASRPYVGQLVVYTVRLHYAVQLIEGALEAPAPEGGGDLRQLGSDASYRARRLGRDYSVVERRYALLPERSGTLALPPARFRGRALGDGRGLGWLGGRSVAALGPDLEMEVRPRPPQAALPWLPARALAFTREAPARTLPAGEPFTLIERLRIEGAVAAQLQAPPLPQIPGAEVFAEPGEASESIEDGVPVLTWRRELAVVPLAPGPLTVPAQGIDWWDLSRDAPARAEAAALDLTIAPAPTAGPAPADPDPLAAPTAGEHPLPALPRGPGFWPWLSLLLALGWAATLLRRRHAGSPAPPVAARPAAAAGSRRAFDRAVREGDLAAIAHELAALAPSPRPAGLSELAGRLEPAAQREAVHALERALWGDGDPARARELVRRAFAGGPAFRAATAPRSSEEADPLPPLYPRG